MLDLNDLYLFVQAVESGGFTIASRRLGIPKSTVSKRVAELEADLGVRLIHRTSRSFSLTELGRDFYEHARGAVIEAESAENIVRRRLAEPSGTVKLTASLPTAQFYLADHLPALVQILPKVRVIVHATDRFVDLVQENFDIAIRDHFAPLPDSGLAQRKIAVEPIFLVAAPPYLSQHGEPQRPEDLGRHHGLLTNPSASVWRLSAESGEQAQVAPKVRMVADESLILLRAAAAGLGITCLPESICRAAVKAGELVRVLPEWNAGIVTTTILMPHRRGQLPAVRAVVEFLAERLRVAGA